jgi:MFS family permease
VLARCTAYLLALSDQSRYTFDQDLSMQSESKGTDLPPGRIGARLGCFAGGFILVSCLVGAFLDLVFGGLSYALGSNHLPPEVSTSSLLRLIYGIGFVLAGLVPFVALLVSLHTILLMRQVPEVARKGWYWVNIIGAIVYWLLFWFLWGGVLGSFGDFGELMRQAEKDVIATLGAIASAASVGGLMALVSTLPLAGLQWLTLRRNVAGASRYVVALLSANAIITGILFGLYLWGTRWGWN